MDLLTVVECVNSVIDWLMRVCVKQRIRGRQLWHLRSVLLMTERRSITTYHVSQILIKLMSTPAHCTLTDVIISLTILLLTA